LLAWAPVQKVLRRVADRSTGPSEEELRTGRSRFWGEVSNASGECRTARLETANGYRLTADGVLVEHDPGPGMGRRERTEGTNRATSELPLQLK